VDVVCPNDLKTWDEIKRRYDVSRASGTLIPASIQPIHAGATAEAGQRRPGSGVNHYGRAAGQLGLSQ